MLELLFMLLLVGFLAWLVKFLPVEETFKQIIRGVLIFAAVLLILGAVFGMRVPAGLRLSQTDSAHILT